MRRVIEFVQKSLNFTLRHLLGRKGRLKVLRAIGWNDFGRALLLRILFPLSNLFRSYAILLLNPHEPKVARFVSRIGGELSVDVGANVGFFTALFARNFENVIGVEPHPEDIAIARHNLRLFHNVTFVQKAVSNKDGYSDFAVDARADFDGNRSQFLVSQKDQFWRRMKWEPINLARIRTTTLATLLKRYPRVDLIKVDVEGAEWEVLEGAESIMEKIRSWIIELHNLQRKKELQKKLSRYGYSLNWLDLGHIFAWRS